MPPQESGLPSFLAGWRSGDEADAQQAHARTQREQSYLQDVLGRARDKEQADRAATTAEYWGTPDDGPDMLPFADRIDEPTGRPVYKSLAGYQDAHKVATARRERTEKMAGGKSAAQASRQRYIDGDLAGQPIPAEVLRRLTSLESGHIGPGWDKDFEEMRQFGDPNWNKTPEERKLLVAEQQTKLAKTETDLAKTKADPWQAKQKTDLSEWALKGWQAEHPEVSKEHLPNVAAYAKSKDRDLVDIGNSPEDRAFIKTALAYSELKIETELDKAAQRKAKGDRHGAKLTDENAMRGQFLRQANDFVTISDSYGRLRAATSNPSAAGDLALIFNYMKILDPGSVVRESEFATAANSGSVPERIWAQYNKVLKGERLSEVMRADFAKQASGQYQAQLRAYKKLEEQFRGLAERAGMDPRQIVVDRVLDHGPDPAAPSTKPVQPSSGWGPIQRIK